MVRTAGPGPRSDETRAPGEAFERAPMRLAALRFAVARARVGLQGVDQTLRGRRHLLHRLIEHRGVSLGGLRRPAELVDDRSADAGICRRSRRCKVGEGFDVAAHGERLSKVGDR